MKHLQQYNLFEQESPLIGWRGQNYEELQPQTGEKATEGIGYYLFENREDALGWGKWIYKVLYRKPKNPIEVDYLGPENSFLFWGEDEEGVLLEPVKDTDSDWIKFHKIASQEGGENLSKCIQILTKLLIENGYDAVMINDMPYWTVLLDQSLVIDYSKEEDLEYKPFKPKIIDGSLDEIYLSAGSHHMDPAYWDTGVGNKFAEYKGFSIFYSYELGKFTFFRESAPVMVLLINRVNGYSIVEGIEVKEEFAGKKYATIAYEFIINYYGNIVSDDTETEGSRRIWQRMLNEFSLYRLESQKVIYDKTKNFEKIPILSQEDLDLVYDFPNAVILALPKGHSS